MIPEIGNFSLCLALGLAIVLATVPLIGAQRGWINYMAVARPVALGQFLFIVVAFLCLVYSFVKNDFSVAYVVNNSNSALPLPYRVSAVWGAHEGSLLLWALILSTWTLAVATFSRSLPLAMVARVLSVMGMVSIGFLLFMLLTSNPFDRMFPAAPDGRDLNPLLQDPGLVIHPPMLYMGYVGFSVAFAFATAALIGGHLDAAWARWSRPWTTVAWMFLTLGIMLGSWWAYYELGWGGWWFWDPVENASFMPWLVGTALMHSLAVTDKRGTFKSWTVLLAIVAFSLSLLGTFLVRSGVLTSVHAFATDPKRGVFILAFLAVVIGGSLALYAWRGPKIRAAGGQFELFSRETALLTNNVLLVVAAATVLLGTLYPLAIDAMGLGKISVGPPYFNTVFVPLMLPLVFLIGVGPLLRWRSANPMETAKRLRAHFVMAVIGSLALLWVAIEQQPSPMVWLAGGLALWITISTLENLRGLVANKASTWIGLRGIPRAVYGMSLAHFGVAVFIVGVTLVSAYGIEKDVQLKPGESFELAGFSYRFEGVRSAVGPNYQAQEGLIRVYDKKNRQVANLQPQKRVYRVQQSPMTEAAINPNLLRDLYVALGDPVNNSDAWTIRLYYKPFVRWIWLGAILMALGGLLGVSDPRYRLSAKKRALELGDRTATASA